MREEYRNGMVFSQAARIAIETSGQAVMVTALTMIAPLLAWYFVSPIRFQAEMGLLLAVILGLNMMGALLLVPAGIGLLRPAGFLNVGAHGNILDDSAEFAPRRITDARAISMPTHTRGRKMTS